MFRIMVTLGWTAGGLPARRPTCARRRLGQALEEWEESLGLASRLETTHLDGCSDAGKNSSQTCIRLSPWRRETEKHPGQMADSGKFEGEFHSCSSFTFT